MKDQITRHTVKACWFFSISQIFSDILHWTVITMTNLKPFFLFLSLTMLLPGAIYRCLISIIAYSVIKVEFIYGQCLKEWMIYWTPLEFQVGNSWFLLFNEILVFFSTSISWSLKELFILIFVIYFYIVFHLCFYCIVFIRLSKLLDNSSETISVTLTLN